jgi:hypothetical protein
MKDFNELEKLEKLSKSMSEEDSVQKPKSKLPFIIIGIVVLVAIIVGVILISNNKNKQEESKPDTIYEESQDAETDLSDESGSEEESGLVEASGEDNQQNTDMLAAYDELLKGGSDTSDMYVTGDVSVGKDKDLKPGIYDMTFIGGSLNGYVNHPSFGLAFYGDNNEVARLILTEGITLEFSEVSKVKFTAVRKAKFLSELGQGEYLVGKDIKEGKYKLSTNGSLGNGGVWWIWICTPDGAGGYNLDYSQEYTAGNTDIAISLKEGDVLSLSCDKWECTGEIVLTELN